MAARGPIPTLRVVTPEIWWSLQLTPTDGRESFRWGTYKDGSDQPLGENLEVQACEARDRDRLQLPAGPAFLHSHSPQADAGTAPAGNLRRGDQPGELIPGPDRG